MLITSFFALGIILLSLQTTLFQSFPDWLGRPDLLFVLLVFLSTRTKSYQGAVLALMYGLIMDIFSGVFLGIYPVLYLGLFFTLKVLSLHFILNDQTYQAPLVAISYLVYNIGIVLFTLILAPENNLMWAWGQVILQMLILAVITVPLFRFFGFILDRVDKKPLKLSIQQSWIGDRFKR